MKFVAGVRCSPREFQSERGRFANLLSLKPSTIVHVADNPLKDFLGAREVGMFTVRLRRPDSEYGHLDPPSESMRHVLRLLPRNASWLAAARRAQRSFECQVLITTSLAHAGPIFGN